MRIVSNDGQSCYVQIQAGEVESRYPSVKVEVTAACRGFSGLYEEVWLAFDALTAFGDQLASVWQSGRGTAELTSMSPREFILLLEAEQRPFRILVTAQLRRIVYPESHTRELAVDIAFPIEFAILEHAIADVADIRARITSAS